MHPAINALNQLANATGIQNYNELSQHCDDKTDETYEIYFKDESDKIVSNFNAQFEKSPNLVYCSYWGCIICYSIEKAADMCSKHNWNAYHISSGEPL